jgi:putative ABC transport system permease protein
MFKNYLKITWAVMKRRKFYTFISLFGISLTLVILIVLTAFLDSVLAPTYPETNRERTLYVQQIKSLNIKEHDGQTSPPSRYFIETYVKSLSTPQTVAMISSPNNAATYINSRKTNIFIRYTDVNFWEITGFEFLEGKGFSEETMKSNDLAVIITGEIRDKYYGKDASVVGKPLKLANTTYRIVGVVKGCSITNIYVGSEIYLPYTQDKSNKSTDINGSYFALILAKNKADMPKIQQDYLTILPKVPKIKDAFFKSDTLISNAQYYAESLVGSITGLDEGDTVSTFFIIASIFALLLMALPALNLVNVNISRIMERASEIGIRKAFGASAWTLTMQFIVENIITTFIGGVVALVISAGIIAYLNKNGIADAANLSLTINWTVAGIALLMSFVFGLLSGVLPAFRMAKLPIVEALKN